MTSFKKDSEFYGLVEFSGTSYRGPISVTGPLGPANKNKPGPFSSPTVRKTIVSWKHTEQDLINCLNQNDRNISYLNVDFIGDNIHELIVPFFSVKMCFKKIKVL